MGHILHYSKPLIRGEQWPFRIKCKNTNGQFIDMSAYSCRIAAKAKPGAAEIYLIPPITGTSGIGFLHVPIPSAETSAVDIVAGPIWFEVEYWLTSEDPRKIQFTGEVSNELIPAS